MNMWHYLLRLVFNRASLSRVLTEMVLERLVTECLSGRVFRYILLAGGSRRVQGSEFVILKKYAKQAKKVVTVNISSSHQPDVFADLTRPWPFRDMSFDCMISTWVLEHLSDPLNFFAEACRVLKTSGYLILTVPFIHRIHSAPHDYWRFTDKAITELSRQAGFTDIRVTSVGGSPFLCAAVLLWPVLRLPIIGVLVALVAWALDLVLIAITRIVKKGELLCNSYVISWISISSK